MPDFEDSFDGHITAIHQVGQKEYDLQKPKRTPMGEYIVPPGASALTSLGDCMPAPSDYSPKEDLTKPSAPQYSVSGRYKAAKCRYHASPADNDTSRDMTWPDKQITLKEKGSTRPYDIRDKAHVNDSVGPARYRIEHQGFGSCGPKWIPGGRDADRPDPGPPNHLVQPVDTHGVDTPGPNYRPNSGYWGRGTKKSFGSSRQKKAPHGPGPAEYTVTETPGGPAYTLAKRLPPPLIMQQAVNTDSPGPGSYELGTTVGKAQAKSLTGRNDVPEKLFVPAPNSYSLPDTVLQVPTAKLTYRPFEVKEGPHPGPTQYSMSNVCLEKAPVYSMRHNGKPAFPDVLNYPLIAQKQATPGPGHYEDNRDLCKNDKPKFSMGKRAKSARNSVPGPNNYHIEVCGPPDATCAPKFSMGRRVAHINKQESPGPAAYNPRLTELGGSGLAYSMTKRPEKRKSAPTPAANKYNLNKGQTQKGVFAGPAATFKSRASPYVYSGFHRY